jgi:hypothetical protein
MNGLHGFINLGHEVKVTVQNRVCSVRGEVEWREDGSYGAIDTRRVLCLTELFVLLFNERCGNARRTGEDLCANYISCGIVIVYLQFVQASGHILFHKAFEGAVGSLEFFSFLYGFDSIGIVLAVPGELREEFLSVSNGIFLNLFEFKL